MVCSPQSAAILLSMLANTCSEELRSEILEVLGSDDMEALNSLAYKQLASLHLVDGSTKTQMKFANALWYNDGLTLRSDAEELLKRNYLAPAYSRDFSNSKAVIGEINAWVNEKTKGMIPEILDELSGNTAAVLANALYFRSAWAQPFNAKETDKTTFKGMNGNKNVDMMYLRGMQHYCEGNDFQAVRMQFGFGIFEATVFLPAEGVDINDFIAKGEWAKELQYTDKTIDYYLPRFKFDSPKMQLTELLKDMGLKSLDRDIFEMFEQRPGGDHKIYQRTSIEFNEEGAQGAAVTWNQMDGAYDPGYKPTIPVMRVDRPFIFTITAIPTGATLFIGRISDI